MRNITGRARILLPALVVAGLLSGCQSAPVDKSRVLARVNGERITEQDYRDYVRARNLQEAALPNNPQSRQIVLNELINRALLAQAARRAGLSRTPVVHAELKEDRENILARAWLKRYLATHAVSRARLKRLYDQEIAKGPHREYKARHILVATKAQALAILNALHHGARFSVLARKDSLDGPSGAQGGELGWFNAADVLPSFYRALAHLRVGQIAPTPLKTRFGWHIIQLQAERPYTPPPFAAVARRLYRAAEQTRVDRMMAALRRKAHIHIVRP